MYCKVLSNAFIFFLYKIIVTTKNQSLLMKYCLERIKMKNSWLWEVTWIKTFTTGLTGIFSLYCTVLFIFHLDILNNVVIRLQLPFICAVVIIIVTSGVGINIGLKLLRYRTHRWQLIVSNVFAGYFLALQLVLTITPSASACHCLSFSEVIMNINNWDSVIYALLLLTCNVATWYASKLKTRDH